MSEKELLNKIDSGCRYEINRAKSKDCIATEFLPKDKITDQILEEFITYYNEFADQKHFNKCNESLIKSAFVNGCVVLTNASTGGEKLVWHAYLVSDTETRLLYSCSLFRDKDGQFRNMVGRANRYLHWSDMLEFKALNYKMYDWGGAGEDDQVKNITQFKKSFGGQEIIFYCYQRYKTLKGKMFKILTKLKDVFKK